MQTNLSQIRAILIALLFFLVSLNLGSGLAQIEDSEELPPTLNLYNMVIGDTWTYNTELDVGSLIDPSDPNWFGTQIQEPLSGQTTRIIEGIENLEYKSKNYSTYVVNLKVISPWILDPITYFDPFMMHYNPFWYPH